MLQEKALAKLVGSYAKVESGRMREALGMLTGCPCETLELRTRHAQSAQQRDVVVDTELLWAQLVSYQPYKYGLFPDNP